MDEWQKVYLDVTTVNGKVSVTAQVEGKTPLTRESHFFALPAAFRFDIGMNYAFPGDAAKAWFDDINLQTWK